MVRGKGVDICYVVDKEQMFLKPQSFLINW